MSFITIERRGLGAAQKTAYRKGTMPQWNVDPLPPHLDETYSDNQIGSKAMAQNYGARDSGIKNVPGGLISKDLYTETMTPGTVRDQFSPSTEMMGPADTMRDDSTVLDPGHVYNPNPQATIPGPGNSLPTVTRDSLNVGSHIAASMVPAWAITAGVVFGASVVGLILGRLIAK